jgi:hypothetical protein
MWRSAIGFAATLFGISGLCFILVEVLKHFNVVGEAFRFFWVAIPLGILYSLKALNDADRLRRHLRLKPDALKFFDNTYNTLLIIFAVIAVIAIPFFWYEVILKTIKNAMHGNF